MKPNKSLIILTGLVALSVIMRFFSFFPSVISHDEGTYFVIARELLQGKIYFADVVDTKPIGIFLIIAIFIKFLSSSIFMIRLFTAIVVGLTAYMIYRISLTDQGEQKPAVAAGVIFIFLLSVYTYFGVFVNPELYYTFFTALAFYLYLRSRKVGGFLLLGFLMGIGFILKYVVLFDLAAWLLVYFVVTLIKKNRKASWNAFLKCAAACLGFLIPFAIVVLYYYRVGHLKEFWFYTFGVTSRIPVERTFLKTVIFIGDFHLRFLPILFFFYYALVHTGKMVSRPVIQNGLVVTWCLMVLLAVILPGKPFGHYFIQMMLPVSIITGRFFSDTMSKPAWINRIIRYPVGPVILIVLVTGNLLMQKHDYFDKPDYPKQVAEFLKPRINREDRVFTGNYHQVLYYLLDKDCPVKYVHRTLMCDLEHQSALKIDLAGEMKALMAMDFRYILMEKPYCYEPLNAYIRNNYILIKEIPGVVRIYERK